MVITDRATRFSYILYTGFMCTFHIVTEWEKGIGPAGYTALSGNPGFFLFQSQYFWLYLENSLPDIISKNIFVFVGKIYIDGVIPIRTAYSIPELQTKDFRMLMKQP